VKTTRNFDRDERVPLNLNGFVDNAQRSFQKQKIHKRSNISIVTCSHFTSYPSPQTIQGPSLNNALRSLIEATVPGGMLWFAVAMDRAYSLLA
jgi:hypothetical protein